ncbi:MAG: hypothetical protein RLZZ142_698 [Verrucomicrobiota bacterium]
MHRILRILALFAALQLLGGHWAVLQTAAWVSMAVEYSKNDSLSSALTKTFDGEHPCQLCHAVKEGRSKEQKQDQSHGTSKTEAVLTLHSPLPPPDFVHVLFPKEDSSAPTRPHCPPSPPPLSLLKALQA